MMSNKGVTFTLGAVTVDPEASGCDPCILIPHLKSLGVNYIIDDQTDMQKETGLYSFYFHVGESVGKVFVFIKLEISCHINGFDRDILVFQKHNITLYNIRHVYRY